MQVLWRGGLIFWSKPLAESPIHHNLECDGTVVNQPTEDTRIRIVLLADQALLRESLGRFLKVQPDLDLAGECATPGDALEILRESNVERASNVDIVLLDHDCGDDGRHGFITGARRTGYQGRFLVVAGTANARQSAAAIRAGASGIFLKSEPPDRLVQAIRVVAAGAVWLDQKTVRILADQLADPLSGMDERKSVECLTDREQKIILGILGGLTNREIGGHLGLSESSVKASIQQLFTKSGVRKRSQLVRVALEGSLKAVAGETSTDPDRTRVAAPAEPPL